MQTHYNPLSLEPNGGSIHWNGRFPMQRMTLFILLALAAVASGCSSSANKAALPAQGAERVIGVRVVEPQTKLDGGLVRVVGRLVPKNEASVSAKSGGTIAELAVDVGDSVQKGQVMARLDTATMRISVEQAQAAEAVAQAGYENARLELERARKLHASGGVAQANLDRAETGHAQAKAGLAQARAARKAAQQALADHTVRAPFDGVVTARQQNVGEFVSMSSPIFSLVDTENLEVVLPVPETVIAAVAPGSKVRGVLSPSGQPFSSVVKVVGDVIDPHGRTVEVRAALEGERSRQMRPHAIVEVEFSEGESLAGLFLPRQALRGTEAERFVWLVEEDVLVRRPVQAEVLSPGVVRVTDGLSGEERVVSDTGGSFEEGMKVRPLR
jgi:RND family efflux transporter MFP subunit